MKVYLVFDDVSKEVYATNRRDDAEFVLTGSYGVLLKFAPSLGEEFREHYALGGNFRLIEVEIPDKVEDKECQD